MKVLTWPNEIIWKKYIETPCEKIFEKLLGNKKSYVVSGFIARSIYGDTTTLGRGGSDYTATVLGAILDAERVTKWTDVNGIMTADPNKVLEASSLENITFSELKNLSKFGSKGIHLFLL